MLYLFIIALPPGVRYAPQEVSRGPGGSVAMKGTFREVSQLLWELAVAAVLPQHSDCIMHADMDAFPGQRPVGCP